MSEALAYTTSLNEVGSPPVPVMDFSARRTLGESILYRLQTHGPQTVAQLQDHFPLNPKTSVYAESWRLKKIGAIVKGDDGRFSIGDVSKLPRTSFTSQRGQRKQKYVTTRGPRLRGPYKPRAAAIVKVADSPAKTIAPVKAGENVPSLLTEVLNDAIALGVKIQRLHAATQVATTQGDTRFAVDHFLSRLGN